MSLTYFYVYTFLYVLFYLRGCLVVSFLPRDAMLARYVLLSCVDLSARLSICLSVCLSPKRLKAGSRDQRRVPGLAR